jgi:long-chain acyl-CoA synthetase
LVVANHGSHLDWLSIWTALPSAHRQRLCPAAAFDYFFEGKSKGARFLLRSLAPFLPWKRSASPKRALEVVSERLEQGSSVLVFPEGTRSRTGELGEFKATIGLLARELDVPVLPVFLTGTHELWPPHQRFPKRGNITVSFGEPQRFSKRDQPYEIRDALSSLYRDGAATC